jgi:hypothetical protein
MTAQMCRSASPSDERTGTIARVDERSGQDRICLLDGGAEMWRPARRNRVVRDNDLIAGSLS